MNVEQIFIAYLTEHGYDGLCFVEDGSIECGCGLSDFAPCGFMGAECEAARGNWESGFFPAVSLAAQPRKRKRYFRPCLPPELEERINAKRGDMSQAEYIEQALWHADLWEDA